MAAPLRRHPDVVPTLQDALGQFVGGPEHVGYTTPDNLADLLPFIRVRRVPGSPRDNINDYANVDVDWFHDTYGHAEALAEQTDAWLRSSMPIPLIDRVEGNAPTELPWDDAGRVRRWGANYTLVSRRRIVL